ncbi:hypothetical protein [Pseudonocardia sp. ICBG601]|uniref:hypothetical protein n=1 Tax=Pseudonocardia sp. ICBG601 TaxID=2846759 RepID=UPI001CF6B879|nr:hypothetical protein [Pseudonocardia sp. ICBG601]
MSYFLLTLCGVAFLWQITDAVRSKVCVEKLSAVLFCLGLGLMVLLYRRDVTVVIDGLLGGNFTALVRNLVLVTAFTAMQLFHLRNIANIRVSLRKSAQSVELTLMSITAAIMVAATASIGTGADLVASKENLHSPAVLTFFVIASVYLIYACLTQICWTTRGLLTGTIGRGAEFRFAALCLAIGCIAYLTLLSRRMYHYSVAIFVSPDQVTMTAWAAEIFLIRTSILAMLLGVMLPVAVADIKRWANWINALISDIWLRPLDVIACTLFPRLLIPAEPEGRGRDGDGVEPGGGPGGRVSPTARELRENRCSDGYGRLHDIIAGESHDSRADVAAVIDVLAAIPGGLPTECESGDTRHLIRISRWLKKNRVADMLAGMNNTPRAAVGVAGMEKGEI